MTDAQTLNWLKTVLEGIKKNGGGVLPGHFAAAVELAEKLHKPEELKQAKRLNMAFQAMLFGRDGVCDNPPSPQDLGEVLDNLQRENERLADALNALTEQFNKLVEETDHG